MDSPDNSRVSVDELVLLLGQKELELYVLRKQLAVAARRIEELTPKPEAPQ